MTLVAARDLSRALIRVCSIAPGRLRHPDPQPVLGRDQATGWPPRCRTPPVSDSPAEFASTAMHIVDNPMLNGETIRLDGAIRMAPR